MNVNDLLDDAELDSAVQFPHPLTSHWQQPRAVFLTGSTGFLGVYLLAALLRQTAATVHCLVRAEDAAAGRVRIQQQMQFYQLWQEAFAPRIVPVIGDLALPRFGLDEVNFSELAASIDVIYHNGALVNAMYPYARLRASNVGGTVEVLKLAGMHHTKPVNFVSTLAVFFSDVYVDQIVLESDYATVDAGLQGGYKQSKWVAEALIREARARGLPAIIHRPGRILGDSHSGIINRLSDLLGNLLQGCLQLEQFPLVDSLINFAPVDYVSEAIVHLGQQASSLNRNFHVCNPHSISWNDLWAVIASLGYKVDGVDFQQWAEVISQRAKSKQDKELYLILRHLLRSPIYLFSPKPSFATYQTEFEMARIARSCPAIDKPLLTTYLRYFEEHDCIPRTAFRNDTAA